MTGQLKRHPVDILWDNPQILVAAALLLFTVGVVG